MVKHAVSLGRKSSLLKKHKSFFFILQRNPNTLNLPPPTLYSVYRIILVTLYVSSSYRTYNSKAKIMIKQFLCHTHIHTSRYYRKKLHKLLFNFRKKRVLYSKHTKKTAYILLSLSRTVHDNIRVEQQRITNEIQYKI